MIGKIYFKEKSILRRRRKDSKDKGKHREEKRGGRKEECIRKGRKNERIRIHTRMWCRFTSVTHEDMMQVHIDLTRDDDENTY